VVYRGRKSGAFSVGLSTRSSRERRKVWGGKATTEHRLILFLLKQTFPLHGARLHRTIPTPNPLTPAGEDGVTTVHPISTRVKIHPLWCGPQMEASREPTGWPHDAGGPLAAGRPPDDGVAHEALALVRVTVRVSGRVRHGLGLGLGLGMG